MTAARGPSKTALSGEGVHAPERVTRARAAPQRAGAYMGERDDRLALPPVLPIACAFV